MVYCYLFYLIEVFKTVTTMRYLLFFASLALVLFVFDKFPIVLYSIYFLSFILTISLRINYWRLEITSTQAEYYSGFNTILNVPLGIMAFCSVSDSYLYYKFKAFGYHDFYLDHSGLIGFTIYAVIVIVGLINISMGIDFPQYITNENVAYKRRVYKVEEKEELDKLDTNKHDNLGLF